MMSLDECIERLAFTLPPPTGPELVKSFSLFSLFRKSSKRPAPRETVTIDSCGLETPTDRALSVIATLSSDINTLKSGSKALSNKQKADKLAVVLAGCLDVVRTTLQTHLAEDEQVQQCRDGCTRAIDIAFTIRSIGEVDIYPSLKQACDNFDVAILSAPFPNTLDSESLWHIFARPREAVQRLSQTVRSISSKGRLPIHGMQRYYTSTPPNSGDIAWMLEMLRGFADHVRPLDNLGHVSEAEEFVVGANGKKRPVGAKRQADLARRATEERRMRAVRVGLEAEVLRCELALATTNANIDAVKRRAQEDLSTPIPIPAGEDGEMNEESAPQLDDDDLELIRASREGLNNLGKISGAIVADLIGDTKWDHIAEGTLMDCLVSALNATKAGHEQALTSKIVLEDWLSPAKGGEHVATTQRVRLSLSPGDDRSDESDSDSDSIASDDSEEDLSHPCPIRTLFRLYDRFEEQRLAVWLSIPNDRRGKMGYYLRGSDGEIGNAWDRLGQALLAKLPSDALLSYGLSVDKLDKWADLADRNTAKKARKRARKTI